MKGIKEKRDRQIKREFYQIITRSNVSSHSLMAAFGRIKDITARDIVLAVRCLIRIVELLEKEKTEKSKRKPNAWAIFAGKQMSKGKSIKEAAELWKKQK